MVITAVDSQGAASGHLHVGDVVVGVPGLPSDTLQTVVTAIRSAPADNVTLVLERQEHAEGEAGNEGTLEPVAEKKRARGPEGGVAVDSHDIYMHQDNAVGNLLAVYLRHRRAGVVPAAEVARVELLAVAAGIVQSFGERGGYRGESLIIRLLYRLKRAHVPLDAKFCNGVMCGLIAAGAAERVREVFEEIEGVNVECFTTLVKAYSVLRRPDNALEVLAWMRREGVKPNVRTYNSLIASCVRGGKLEKARGLFSEMLVDEVRPNAVSWNIIINWYVQEKRGARRLQGALKAFGDMKASGVQPNLITYTTIMKAYAKSGQVSKAEEVFAEMKRHMGMKLDSSVYNTLLGAYAARLDWRRCLELLDEMDGFYIPDPLCLQTRSGSWNRNSGVPAHSGSFSRRRPWLADTGEEWNGEGWGLGGESGCAPDAVSFSLAVKACAGAGQPERAREVFDEMMERGFFPPSQQAVVSLMAGYAKMGMLTESFEVLKKLKSWGVFPEPRVMSALMHGCVTAGQAELALAVYAKLKSGRFEGDVVTYTVLLKAYGMMGDMEKMCNVLKGMQKSGNERVRPNVVTYNVMIECSLRANRADLALKALDELLSGKVGKGPDRNTFEALTMPIKGVEKGKGRWRLESGMYEGRGGDGEGLDMGKEEWLQYLMDVLRRVREAGKRPNGVLYEALLTGCEACGEWYLGLGVMKERKAGGFVVGKRDGKVVRRLEDMFRAMEAKGMAVE